MNRTANDPKPAGRERLKLALIPILLVIFCALLFRFQSGRSGSSSDASADLTRTRRARPALADSQKNVALALPPIEVAAVAAFSPFDKPSFGIPVEPEPTEDLTQGQSVPDNVPTQVPQESTESRRTIAPLQAVIRFQDGFAAIIDSTIVRAGDTLDGGLRVVEITSQGVVVEPYEESPP